MVDMHGNSPKTLRQDLLKQSKENAAGNGYASVEAGLIAGLNHFLANEGKSIRSIALYWPIQDEIDLRPTLLSSPFVIHRHYSDGCKLGSFG